MKEDLRKLFRKGFMVNLNMEYTLLLLLNLFLSVAPINVISRLIGLASIILFCKSCVNNGFTFWQGLGRFVGYILIQVIISATFSSILNNVIGYGDLSVTIVCLLCIGATALNFTYWSCSQNK